MPLYQEQPPLPQANYAPSPSQLYLQQSQTNFALSLGNILAAAAERRREERAEREAQLAAQQQAQQAEAAKVAFYQSQIADFAADYTHPYYGIVRERMAGILRTGRAATLQQAYDAAVAEDPDVQSLIALHTRGTVAPQ